MFSEIGEKHSTNSIFMVWEDYHTHRYSRTTQLPIQDLNRTKPVGILAWSGGDGLMSPYPYEKLLEDYIFWKHSDYLSDFPLIRKSWQSKSTACVSIVKTEAFWLVWWRWAGKLRFRWFMFGCRFLDIFMFIFYAYIWTLNFSCKGIIVL